MSQTAVQQAIHQLFEHQNLSTEQADAAMMEIMTGEATEAQIGA
ncbi:MAG: anthranilate phosphoribosyltransferase, partial [Caldilineaceae bacterium]|nr:anthranilate phosphoribosyltransferase [Caldilineaceae bacterium]